MFPLTKRHLVALNKRIRSPHICYRDYKRLNVKQSFLNMQPLFSKKDVDYRQTCIPTHELLTKPYLGQVCKSVGLSKSEYVGTNTRAGPTESMTMRVLTEVLEIGERMTNMLNAHDLSLRIKHVCFLHSPWLPHLYFPNSCHA